METPLHGNEIYGMLPPPNSNTVVVPYPSSQQLPEESPFPILMRSEQQATDLNSHHEFGILFLESVTQIHGDVTAGMLVSLWDVFLVIIY